MGNERFEDFVVELLGALFEVRLAAEEYTRNGREKYAAQFIDQAYLVLK